MVHVLATATFSLLAATIPLGEEIEFVANPPEVEGLPKDLKIGYYYKTHAFSMWTSGGRFVLYHNEVLVEYLTPTHQDWIQILGKHPESIYPIPWSYRIPVGWIVLGVGCVVVFGVVMLRGSRKSDPLALNTLTQDEQIGAGMSHYIRACSEAGLNPYGWNSELLADSAVYLVEEHGVEPRYASAGLEALLQHMIGIEAAQVQESAALLEGRGDWSKARDAYESAAALYDVVAPDHAEFIRRQRIRRVEKKIDPFAF